MSFMVGPSNLNIYEHRFINTSTVETTERCPHKGHNRKYILWLAKVNEHVSYKSEYTVMGPCVVIVRSWTLMVRTWVLWWGHPILIFMSTGLSTPVLLRPQKDVPIRDTIENTWKWRDFVMICWTTVHSELNYSLTKKTIWF